MDNLPNEIVQTIFLDYISLFNRDLCDEICFKPSILISNQYQESLDHLSNHINKSRQFCTGDEKIYIECFIYHMLLDMPYLEEINDGD